MNKTVHQLDTAIADQRRVHTYARLVSRVSLPSTTPMSLFAFELFDALPTNCEARIA